MPSLIRNLYVEHVRNTPLGDVARACRNRAIAVSTFFYRANYVRRYYWERLRPAFGWLINSSETANFTYELTARNVEYIAETVAVVTGRPSTEIRRYLSEITIAKLGRRMAWYAAVRALKPRLVVETGVDRGLGSIAICSALLRNREEGHAGRYFGTDISTSAGALFVDKYKSVGTILYGDSIESIRRMQGPIDLFINDSDHSADYERREYETVHPLLSDKALVIGDNAHVTDALLQFSRKHGRSFAFLREESSGHWYLGAGIGFSFRAQL